MIAGTSINPIARSTVTGPLPNVGCSNPVTYVEETNDGEQTQRPRLH